MFGRDLIAIDWGTTNRRIYVLSNGVVTHTERDDRGANVIAQDDFASELESVRARLRDLPVLMAGMVGSSIGWRIAPYVPLPAGLDDLCGNLTWIDARTAIVPGLSLLSGGRADVMRGEEVQLLGAVAAGIAPADAMLVQPGTHCKWVTMAGGRVVDFTTSMTGELFALLEGHSLLRAQMGHGVTVGAAFLEGVAEGKQRDLASALFGVRASGLLGQRDDADAASFVSGLLIGADIAARLPAMTGDTAYILDDSTLGTLYAAALEASAKIARIVSSRQAFVAGATAIGKLIE